MKTVYEIVKEVKLGDALYAILEVEGSMCECCLQIKKIFAIRRVYVGSIQEDVEGGRRIELYKEKPSTLKNSRYGMHAEFRPVASYFLYSSNQDIALNKDDLLSQLEKRIKSKKELDEFVVKNVQEAE